MIVYRNGTVTGRPFQKLYNQTVNYPGTEGTGNYSLVLYKKNGEAFKKYPFNSSFACNIEPAGLIEVEAAPLLTVVEWTDELGKINLYDAAGNLLFTRTVSEHTPTLKITFPQQGTTLNTKQTHTINWQATDQDNDALWHTVLIKKENTQVWQSLASRTQNTSITFTPTDAFTEGKYELQLKTTDGVNTATETITLQLAANAEKETTIPLHLIPAALIITTLIIAATIAIINRKKQT